MRTVSTALLRQMIAQGSNVHVINVLPPDSFAQTRIPGSVDVPFRRETRGPHHHAAPKQEDERFVEDVLGSVGGLEARIVVCFGRRVKELQPHVAELLERAGFRDVLALERDLEDWEPSELESVED